MSPERTNAYRRVTLMLQELGPSKLLEDEQERIRFAADTLIFSSDADQDVLAHEAMVDVDLLCSGLVESGRWEPVTASRLAEDVRQCGPRPTADLKAA